MTTAASNRGTIVVLNRDLMFGARITSHLRPIGYTIVFARDTTRFVELMRSTHPRPVLGILDMNGTIAWDMIDSLAHDPTVTIPLLGFGPHTDVDGRRAAKAADVTRIVSNSEFHGALVSLVERYATPPP